eukprot:GFKZ01002722.1.p1 GENE.GFKZ01002722.1~~GFKZ01002722.1.p1  ORF type:complete len:540 (+),score=118.21 GFKZ01002722.1:119-1621(+)
MGTAPPDADAVTSLPVDAHSLPPPPKFPSLTDVTLPSATAAGDKISHTPPPPPTTTETPTVATTPPPTLPAPPAPAPHTPTDSQFSDEIAAVLERNSIVPGSAQQRAYLLGEQIWNQSDQDELDQLLTKGEDAYVPPDITAEEIAARESYVLLPPTNKPDAPASTQDESSYNGWSHLKYADKTEGSTAASPVTEPSTEIEKGSSKPIEEDTATKHVAPQTEKSTAPPDVSNTIFGMRFKTVPVTSRKPVAVTAPAPEATEIVEHTVTDVELRTDTAAHINVTDDYGLKGGHATGVNDAAFLKDGTLVTCGDDGKVCIWDMEERAVESEFLPYAGEAVTMVYPMPDEEDDVMKTLMTLSAGRVMRIWAVDAKQAVLLRTTNVKQSEKALYMSVPHISKELKARAAAAAAAAAVTTTEAPEIPVQLGSASVGATEAETAEPEAAPDPPLDTGKAGEPTEEEQKDETEEAEQEVDEEKERKRFSITKVLSFGRSNSGRKAVAS